MKFNPQSRSPNSLVYFPYISRGEVEERVSGNRILFENWCLFEDSSVLLLMGKWPINMSCAKSALEKPTLY